jgi:hypothetical protein
METFNSLTVWQYQELYRIAKSDMDGLDKMTESVAVLIGKTNRDIEDMPLPEFNRLSAEISKIFESAKLEADPKRIIDTGTRKYGITYEPKNLRAGQYIEVQEFGKGDIIENLHLIMASISYPVKKNFWGRWVAGKNDSSRHEIVANDMLSAKFIDVYSACVFFCHLLKNSIVGLESYLEKRMKQEGLNKNLTKLLMMDLAAALDGFIPPLKSQNTKGSLWSRRTI